MHSIHHSISTETGSQTGRLQLSSYLRVIRPTHLPKLFNRIVLSNLDSDRGSTWQVINQFFMFRQKFICFIELLGDGMVKPDHLHCADFESRRKDAVNNLSDIFIFNCMRFDYAKCTVLKIRSCSSYWFIGEDEVQLSLHRLRGITPVTGIFGAVLPVEGSERPRGFFFGFERVGGSNELSPLGDGVLCD